LSEAGVGELTDFMPIKDMYDGNILIRRLTCIKGDAQYIMQCSPSFNYGLSRHSIEVKNDKKLVFKSSGDDHSVLRLISTVPVAAADGTARSEFTLKPGESADFILEYMHDEKDFHEDIAGFISDYLYKTIGFWRKWSAESNYKGRWRETVNRSALVMKLMTSQRYGSIIASPTFSLPEYLGGDRNWDYRYTWIRDASFTIYSLINLGYKKEATSFIKWIEQECEDVGKAGHLNLMYTYAGENVMDEKILDHLEGYKNSKPVRVGNNAKKQIQLDIYGELMDSVYLYNKYIEPISFSFWKALERQINWLCNNWHIPDEGIWEVRGGKREFLYSRFMCWVAIDRAVKLARSRSFPLQSAWVEERDKIFKSIFADFWNDNAKSFVQYKGAENVDASALLMPLMRFISPRDPLWISTLKRIEKELVSDSLVYRYRHREAASDGLKSGEGTFSMCTFWYIECLSRAGQLQKARLFFEKMLGYSNHLGLYSEQLGLKGEHLGNYPQAFTHLGLISAAINLSKNLEDSRNKELNIKNPWQ
ncbi:MAG: glycoside hydrolase family 15 protein, partial [Ignavibacteria bacterium]